MSDQSSAPSLDDCLSGAAGPIRAAVAWRDVAVALLCRAGGQLQIARGEMELAKRWDGTITGNISNDQLTLTLHHRQSGGMQ